MSTNTDILTAFFQQVKAWATVPVAYPGVTFTPPATGLWVKIYHAPNDLQPDVNGGAFIRRGNFSIVVYGKPDSDTLLVSAMADSIETEWVQGRSILTTKVTGTSKTSMIEEPSLIYVAVSIAYSG